VLILYNMYNTPNIYLNVYIYIFFRIDEKTHLKHKPMKVYTLEANSIIKRKW